VERITDDDLITLLSLSLGGRDVASAAWESMDGGERMKLLEEAVRITQMAAAARRQGLADRPDVAGAIRWGTNSLLADALEREISAAIKVSDFELRRFYENNISRYFVKSGVRCVTVVFENKDDAVNVRKSGESLVSIGGYSERDWTDYEKMPRQLAELLRAAKPGTVVGPIRSGSGYVLYEAVEKRAGGLVPFEECMDKVRKDYINREIDKRVSQ
jgi:hypothetical protein